MKKENVTFEFGTLIYGAQANHFLENTEPIHRLPHDKQSKARQVKFFDLIYNQNRGSEFPPVLIFEYNDKATTGCHRQHAWLEATFEKDYDNYDCCVPVFYVTEDQKPEFFEAIGVPYNAKLNPSGFYIQEAFHKLLVKKGLYTSRILNRRLKD